MSDVVLVSMTVSDIFVLCTNTCPLLMVLWRFPLGRTKSEGCIHGRKNLDEGVGSFEGLFGVNYGHFPVTLRFSDHKCVGRKPGITMYTEW